MSVVWLILKIMGLTLAGALALALIALLIPAVLEISYRHKELNITLRYLFLRFRLIKNETVELKDDAPEIEIKTENTEEKHKKKKVKLDIGLILELLKPGGRAVWYITRRLRIYHICIRAVARGEDCAAVGMNAGRYWAVIGLLSGAINGVWPRAQYTELTVLPDFANQSALEEKYSCKIAALPIIIIIAGLGFVLKYSNITNEREKKKMTRQAQAAVGVETT